MSTYKNLATIGLTLSKSSSTRDRKETGAPSGAQAEPLKARPLSEDFSAIRCQIRKGMAALGLATALTVLGDGFAVAHQPHLDQNCQEEAGHHNAAGEPVNADGSPYVEPVCNVPDPDPPVEEPPVVEAPLDPAVVLGHLKSVKVPLPDLSDVVRNKAKAIALGKAFFWDLQVGSDGQACASCHFKAGADPRVVNQVSPGLLVTPPDTTFQNKASGGKAGPNVALTAGDFPFFQLFDPDNRNSHIKFDTNDTMSSQGTFSGDFNKLIKNVDGNGKMEKCGPADSSVFHNNMGHPRLAARKVEPRNSPTTINAVFFFDNFWDGRAKNAFNGKDPFGLRSIKHDPAARILINHGSRKNPTAGLIKFVKKNASLASQAVGPPLSDFEMSCAKKAFAMLGRKMLTVTPLHYQAIASNDSVLAAYRQVDGTGLTVKYGKLIRQAFQPKYWNLKGKWGIHSDGSLTSGSGFKQIEQNFSLFWGISIMLYEATLVSDQTRFADFVGCTSPSCSEFIAPDSNALTEKEKDGLDIFLNQGNCVNCHKGPDFTGAGVHLQAENQEGGLVERMLMADQENGPALYDNGFYNIGVTPTKEDIGRGGEDPFGRPLSWTRQFINSFPPCTVDAGPTDSCIDMFEINTCKFEILVDGQTPESCDPNNAGHFLFKHRHAVDGAFKTPTLLNVALTAPYMHDGSMKSLEEVVRFYNRGGNRRGNCDSYSVDTTATKHPNTGRINCNLDPDIAVLGLTPYDQEALVAFLKTLTDRRVQCESDQFDHPSLVVANGQSNLDSDVDGRADDEVLYIPAVGKDGLPNAECHANSGNLFIGNKFLP